jgi:hypothetical protein
MAMRIVVVAVVATVVRERDAAMSANYAPTGAVGTGRSISTVDRCLDLRVG